MNTYELLEAAQLDALGLLDDAERDAFDAAFFSASPDVQSQIRREQARLVRTDWLPSSDVEPRAGLKDAVLTDVAVAALRGRVLGAVHQEIEKVAPVVGASRAAMHASHAHAASHPAGRVAPALRPSRRVTPLWRAAALGFASASIALGGAVLHLYGKYDSLYNEARNELSIGTLAQIPGFQANDLLLNPNIKRFALAPLSPDLKARATVHIDPERDNATVYFSNLVPTEGKVYRIVAIDEEGTELSELARFDGSGGLKGQAIMLNKSATPRLAIMLTSRDPKAGPGVLLLASGPLLG